MSVSTVLYSQTVSKPDGSHHGSSSVPVTIEGSYAYACVPPSVEQRIKSLEGTQSALEKEIINALSNKNDELWATTQKQQEELKEKDATIGRLVEKNLELQTQITNMFKLVLEKLPNGT